MHCRSFTLVLAAIFFLVACSPAPETVLPSATETSVPTTQPPTSEPAAPTVTSQPAFTMDWLTQLEVIDARNWSRLQLLKTFPAEMPLNHSAVAISPDGKTMAVGSSSGAQIFFFDLASGQLSRTIPINGVVNVNAYFNVIEYLSDGTIMANSDSPYMIYHMDAAGNVLSAWDGISFALSADKSIMAHHTDEGITLLDIANNAPLLSLEETDGMYFSFSPDGSRIAIETIGIDFLNTVIWDIPNQTLLRTLDETANARFSSDGNFLAVTSYVEGTNPLKIFSPDGADQITTLQAGDSNSLNGRPPLWSLDGSVIAAQISNGSPVAWDTTNWQPLEAPALQGELYSFSSDGRILITRALDGGIMFWGVLP